MKVPYIIFDGITWLDFIGIYVPVSRLKSLNYLAHLSWDICSFTENVIDNFGLEINADKINNSLTDYDVIIIPGGYGTGKLQFDNDFINWIKTAQNVKYKISICTGSLVLGAAGFLKGKKATTYRHEYETLKPYCGEVLKDTIVEDNNVITAGAVSAAIDVGLRVCEKWAGPEAKNKIGERIDFNG